MNALKGGITLEILACKAWLRDRKRPQGREKKSISRPMRALRALSICQNWSGALSDQIQSLNKGQRWEISHYNLLVPVLSVQTVRNLPGLRYNSEILLYE